jgi:hypothetical protein
MVIGWSSSKIVSGSRVLPPRWPPQCNCIVIESSFDPGELLQAPGSLWFLDYIIKKDIGINSRLSIKNISYKPCQCQSVVIITDLSEMKNTYKIKKKHCILNLDYNLSYKTGAFSFKFKFC